MITLEQLQDRREARNPAQWDWRLLDAECHEAGNSPVLNLNFGRVIKPARSNRGVNKARRLALLRQRRATSLKFKKGSF
jgi:hypothetical protein